MKSHFTSTTNHRVSGGLLLYWLSADVIARREARFVRPRAAQLHKQ